MRRLVLVLVAAVSTLAASPAVAASRWQVDATPEPAGVDFTGLNGAFVASATQAWAVGMQRQSNSLNFTALIDSWNGSVWSTATPANVPGASITELNAVGGSGPDDVWAAGDQNGSNSTLIERFNGKSWSNVSSPAIGDGVFNSVSADTASDAWAVGGQVIFEPHNTFTTSLAEHWNGTSWEVVSVPFGNTSSAFPKDSLVSVVAISPTDAWAIGLQAEQHGRSSVLLHWNGRSWSIFSQPVSGAVLNSLSATGPDDVWAVGNDGLIEHFDGTNWTQVSNPAGGSKTLSSVAALSATDAWTASSDGTATEQWNGTQWKAVPTASSLPAGLRLEDVAGRSGGPLFAVGVNDDGGNNLSTILQQPEP